MPKYDWKRIQIELKRGVIWPIYWIYGNEKFQMREIISQIRTILAPSPQEMVQLQQWGEEKLDGTQVSGPDVLDAARELPFGGGPKLILIHEAHSLKNPEAISPLFHSPGKTHSVCIFLSKDLDGRKKFSKILVEHAATVACEEIPEDEREEWIRQLAHRRQLNLAIDLYRKLTWMEPWSLDIVDQELEKISLMHPSDVGGYVQVPYDGPDSFMNSFFSRELTPSLAQVQFFASLPEEAFPLLGLLSWNVRQLSLYLIDQRNKTRQAKIPPFQVEKLRSWSRYWKLNDLIELQHELTELDYSLKQTPLHPLGLWSRVVTRFCRPSSETKSAASLS